MSVVVDMGIVVDVAIANFIANSPLSKEILRTSLLSKNLNVNTLIYGEIGVGKRTLANIISSSEFEILNRENITKDLDATGYIIEDLSSIDLTTLNTVIQSKNIKIIAILKSKELLTNRLIDEIFAIKINIPPLLQREEDILPLVNSFKEELNQVFKSNYSPNFDIELLKTKLSKNAISLKEFIYSQYIMSNSSDDVFIMDILENYFDKRIHENSLNDYRDFLYLYDRPLIKSEFKKYKSQVQVSKHLGLNRNTLRKKLEELDL
jgi:DNA-binding NtrC family response regulator